MKPKTTKKAPETPRFTLSGFINGTPFTKYTHDVRKTIKSLEPEQIFTESYITLSQGSGENKIKNDQKLSFIKTKQVFRDEVSLDIFVQNLLVPFN